jgi:hypothetical protein
MKNKELFNLNPEENNLLNDGVVEINISKDKNGLATLRHELKTFVCEGEYQKGLYRILDTYLKFIDQPKQPAVWVSGFFGSGKSHLVKMLGYLWQDYKFQNGETARTIKPLPQDIQDLFVELQRKQDVYGRLSIVGTLKDFPSADVRYSFLQLVLNALGLPPQYHHFKFIYWAKEEGIYDELKNIIEAQGKDFVKEYENLFVSTALAKAVLQIKPDFAENEAQVKESFKINFKRQDTISRDQFINTLKTEVFPLSYGNKIPCTIIVLDEVQQFIGQDGNKTIDIQNLAQDVCSNFEGKLLLVGTGQNALAETPQLQPLHDRFSVKVLLSDTDVETVTRKTILEKKPTVVTAIDKKIESSMGEISRTLEGTTFGYTSDDRKTAVADYPLIPPIRKFWKKILQVIDVAGTTGQLRSQIRVVNDCVKILANKDLGYIIPGDFIFEQKQRDLLQSALLLQETNNLIEERKAKGGDSLLEGRILSVVFLLDQLPKDTQGTLPKSNANTIADLLIDNVNEPTDAFRNKVKELLKKLVDKDKVLMPVGDEFKLQTKEGAEWEQEYTKHAVAINAKGEDKIQALRQTKVLELFKDKTKTINILHGTSKLKRDFEIWDKTEKPYIESRLNIWLRDGWQENEAIVLNEIRSEVPEVPLAYIYVKKLRDADLRSEIIKFLAAKDTMDTKGLPNTPEGQQAKKGMETRKNNALASMQDIIDKVYEESMVYLAGGTEVNTGTLRENIESALNSIADRQFPDFKSKADYKDWDKALRKAQEGDSEALKRINFNGDVKDHPASVDLLRFIGNGAKTGRDIRNHFMKSPYGWSQDAIDTIIIALKNSELISTAEANLKPATINAATFKKEVHTISAAEKVKLRKIYQDAGISCKPNEELATSNIFLSALKQLGQSISGNAPLPEPINLQFVKDIENLDGNERLRRILEEQADLTAKFEEWQKKEAISKTRLPLWRLLTELEEHAPATDEAENILREIDAISTDRLLFHEPGFIEPLLVKISDYLKELLNGYKKRYLDVYQKGMDELQGNEYFKKLIPEQKHAILQKYQLLSKPEVKELDARGVNNELTYTSLNQWETKISALPEQFRAALEEAMKIAVPDAKSYRLPKQTISNKSELDDYLDKVKQEIQTLLDSGNSVILK